MLWKSYAQKWRDLDGPDKRKIIIKSQKFRKISKNLFICFSIFKIIFPEFHLKLSRWGLTLVFQKMRIWLKIKGNPSPIDFILGAEMFPEAWNTIGDQFKGIPEWFQVNLAAQNITFHVLEPKFSEFSTWCR